MLSSFASSTFMPAPLNYNRLVGGEYRRARFTRELFESVAVDGKRDPFLSCPLA
jgi:hypothetical protein